jgi:LacI family transcriptional regulator
MEKIFAAEGYSIILCLSHYNADQERRCFELLDSKCVDGVISFGITSYAKLRKLMVPCVQMDIAAELTEQDVVSSNHVLGVKIGLEYLFSLGHTRIAFVTNDVTTADRKNAYNIYMRERGYESQEFMFRGKIKNEKGGYTAAQKLLTSPTPPTALFCANDYIAIGAMKALRDMGLRVPEDVSVLGFDDSEMLDYLDCPLTTGRQHKHKLGEQAANILVMRMREDEGEGEKMPFLNISLRPELVERDSCAPCKNSES